MAQDLTLFIPANQPQTTAISVDPPVDKAFATNPLGTGAYLPLISAQFSAESVVNVGSATAGAGAGKATFHPLTVSRFSDISTPGLLANLARGSHWNIVQLVVRRSGTTGPAVFAVHEFQTVFVTALDESFDGDQSVESVQFAYGAVVSAYRSQKPDGTWNAPVKSGWSVITNTATTADGIKFV